MEPQDVISDIRRTGSVYQPRTVLVQDGKVIGIFAAGQDQEADRAITRNALTGGKIVRVYAVDARLPDPPEPGNPVDPTALGWVDLERADQRPVAVRRAESAGS
jgi:hypothetical protein